MDGKMLARIGAVVFVGVAITATAIEMTRPPEEPEVRILRPDLDAQTAPSRPMLRRCRDMGEAATRDPACLKAWAQNRDRFLKQGSETSAPANDAPGAPTTLFPSTPDPAEDPIRKETAPADVPAVQPKPSQPPCLPTRECADMQGTGVIDHFLEVFTRYIDGGFGLLKPEVAFIATTLIVIDVVLAALFWSWGADEDIIARLVKKTLFVGVFAYIIGNWNNLARIVFESFAGLGLKASGTGFSVSDLMRPGKVAQTGLDAGRPLLDSISDLMGWVSFFENFIQIACLLFAWALILLAFFILAVQLFVTLIEFKLTTLAGFVLIPFGLFGKSAFMAERVLGNVISSGIKVLVLAVIIGIGSTLFSEFTAGFGGATPTIDDAMAIVLAALSLLGLGIFGPGIANGLVSGGPQLGAGAAIGTGLAAGGMVAAGGAAFGAVASGGASLIGGAVASGGASLIGGAAAAARGGAALAGGASTAYSLGAAGQSGASAVASGLGNVASTGAQAAVSPLKKAAGRAADSLKQSYQSGARSAFEVTDGTIGGEAVETDSGSTSTAPSASAGSPPAWAKRMQRSQKFSHGVQAAAHAVKSGDAHGGGSSVNLSESD